MLGLGGQRGGQRERLPRPVVAKRRRCFSCSALLARRGRATRAAASPSTVAAQRRRRSSCSAWACSASGCLALYGSGPAASVHSLLGVGVGAIFLLSCLSKCALLYTIAYIFFMRRIRNAPFTFGMTPACCSLRTRARRRPFARWEVGVGRSLLPPSSSSSSTLCSSWVHVRCARCT